ncbi:MAG TPA: pilus assembly protein PilM [Candidatus Sulfotelmatobacter sp.]|nr:pilus assembly protein PilM [Candidatus Sulfotelmatobacter sp.]
MTRSLPLGIDVGSARTCVALAELDAGGTPRLVAAASRTTGDDPSAAIAGARTELSTRERRCVLALRAPDSHVREIALPPLRRRERERAAGFEAARFAPHALHDGVLRFVPLTPGRTVVAVARRSAVERAVEIARVAGLHAVAVDDGALALLRAFAADAVVDVGLTACTVIVRGEALPLTRIVPLGGRALTDAIVAGLGVDETTAELRKRGVGMAGAGESARAALVEQIASAFVELRAAAPREPAGAVLTGNGARLQGLAAALERALGVPTRLGTFAPDACVTLPADVVRVAAPDWGLAYGLALWEHAT